ncbi:hypothetical protein [Thermovibrio sp.]
MLAIRIRNYIGTVLKSKGYTVKYIKLYSIIPEYLLNGKFIKNCFRNRKLECIKPSYYYFLAGLTIALIYIAKKNKASLLLLSSTRKDKRLFKEEFLGNFNIERFSRFFEELKATLSLVSDFPHNGLDVSNHIERVITKKRGKSKEWNAVIENLELSLSKNTRKIELIAEGTERYNLSIPNKKFRGYLVKEYESAFIIPPYLIGHEYLDPEAKKLTLKDINFRVYFILEFEVEPLTDGKVLIRMEVAGRFFRAPWGEKEYLGNKLKIDGNTAFIYEAEKKESYEDALIYFNNLIGEEIPKDKYLYVRTASDTPFIHTEKTSLIKGYLLQKYEMGSFYAVLDKVFEDIKGKFVFTIQYPMTQAQLKLLLGDEKRGKEGRGYVASHGATFMAYLSQDFWIQRARLIPAVFLTEGVFNSESARHFLAKSKNPLADRRNIFIKRNGYAFPFANNGLIVETGMRIASMIGNSL